MQEAEEIERRLTASGVDSEIAAWCAQRHVEGDSTELLQLTLLRALWAGVLEPSAGAAPSVSRWPEPSDEGAAFLDGAVAKRLVDGGASVRDLDALVRSAQVQAIHDACRVFDDGGLTQLRAILGAPLARGLGWAVVAHDPAVTPPQSLGGLHSTFAQLDPRGVPGASPE